MKGDRVRKHVANAIPSRKCRKLCTCELGTVIAHQDLGQPMSCEQGAELLNSRRERCRSHVQYLEPFGKGVHDNEESLSLKTRACKINM